MPPDAATTPAHGGPGRRRSVTAVSTLIAAVVVALIASLVPVGAGAQTTDDAAQQAAREIQAARDRANEAADRFFQAQSDLEVLEDDALRLEAEAEELEARVERLRRDVESLAVARFAASGSAGIPLLTGLQAPKDQVQAEVLTDVVSSAGGSALDEFAFAEKELADKRDEVERRAAEVEQQQIVFTELQEQAEAEVVRLREIEEQRLTDEAVRRALEAQQAAGLARLEEAARRQAEAASRALPNPGVVAAEAAAAEAAAAAAAEADADADGTDPDGTLATTSPADVPSIGSPIVTVAPNTGASGGTSGGRTGTGGAGSSPIGVLNGDVYVDAILCPMLGSAYGDTWGAPRSGGRRHEGVDMLAPTGVPIYAVVSGYVTFKQNRLGGNAASLAGDNGNRYYYAHFSGYEGVSRRVSQGDVIGYNGDTGNATGVPHLHFQVHPGGGLAVNPTPSVRAAGC